MARNHRAERSNTGGGIWVVMVVALASMLAIPVAAGARTTASNAHATFSGFATGDVLHADAIEAAGSRLVNVDEAFSGAVVNTRGLASSIQSEMHTLVQPALTAKKTYARGSGLEVGLGLPAGAANQLKLAGLAQAAAAPTSKLIHKEIGPFKLNPLAWASLLRGQAAADWPAGDTCPIGHDISRGDGYAADLQLVNMGGLGAAGRLLQPVLALDANNPERTVAQSTSRTVLVRQTDSQGHVTGKNFGLMSEVRMTIAPVTLLRGTPSQFTIEFLGQWVMQVFATGLPGGSFVHYGPGTVSPQTPVLRTVNVLGKVTNLLTTQQLLGNAGLVLPLGPINIALGEDPRAIGGSASSKPSTTANGTRTSAAVDVVRVSIPGLTNIRVGHMEAAAAVPAGGIVCHLPTSKIASAKTVAVGKGFTTTIKVSNPFGCDLHHVRVVDLISTKQGARFAIDGTSPAATSFTHGASLASGVIRWTDIGTVPAGGSKSVTASFLTAGSAGLVKDIADATAVIGSCSGSGSNVTGVATSVTGAQISGGSEVVPVNLTVVKSLKELPGTGVASALYVVAGLGLLGAAWGSRRVLKRYA